MNRKYLINDRRLTQPRPRRPKGFTLVELMITVAVVAIALAFAVPNFQYLVERNRLSSNVNLLVGALNYARVEATKRGVRVRAGEINSSTGQWGVWRDIDGGTDDTYDSGEELRVFEALPDSLTLTSSVSTYVFLPTGFALAAGSLTVCTSSSNIDGVQINVALSGRVQTESYVCP